MGTRVCKKAILISVVLPMLPGCGGGEGVDTGSAIGSCPAMEQVNEEWMPSMDSVWDWIREMDAMGVRLTGSPAHNWYIDFLQQKMEQMGCRDIQRDAIEIHRWVPVHWSLERIDEEGNLEETLPVAGYYPYSGCTGITGEMGPLAFRTVNALTDVRGKIVLMDSVIPQLTAGALALLATYIHEPDPDDLSELLAEDYRRPWLCLAAVVPSLTDLKFRGAKGLVLIVDLPPEEARGQYMPFTTGYGDLPAVLVDRETGEHLKRQIAVGNSIRVRLVMEAYFETVPTYHLTGFLPGQTDALIVLNSHTDGQNAVEENGPLGLLALGEYFSHIPSHCRPKTLCFSFVTGHFHSEVPDSEDWIGRHPDLVGRMEAALCLEHLGTTQWLETSPGVYGPTGKCEPAAMFVSRHPELVDATIASLKSQDLRRVVLMEGLSFGVGIGFMKHKLPMIGYLSGPTYLLNYDNGGTDKLDRGRIEKEIRTFIEIVTRVGKAHLPSRGGVWWNAQQRFPTDSCSNEGTIQ